MGRLLAVARVTFLESIRSKSLYTLFVVVVVQIATLQMFEGRGTESTVKTLQMISYYCLNTFVFLTGLMLAGTQIPRDIANRHLFFIFVKPLTKAEFLFGKILGIWSVMFLMYMATCASLLAVESFVESTEPLQVKARSTTQSFTTTAPIAALGRRRSRCVVYEYAILEVS